MSAELTLLHRIDHLIAPATPAADRIAALGDASWQIRQAALNGMTHTPAADYLPAILDCLDDQDARDLYGAKDQWSLDGSTSASSRSASARSTFRPNPVSA
jgi:hypothetical protein